MGKRVIRMGRIKNEKGYSLLLTIFVFVLFTILTMTLLTAAITGSKRNTTSEDNIQAQELAVMGTDHLKNQINKELIDALGTTGLFPAKFNEYLESILNRYKNNGIINYSGETGYYNAKIININSVANYPLKRKVTIESTGVADGQTKKVKTTIEFGAQSTLETLKYTVGAYKSEQCVKNKSNCIPGEGNLFLHGGTSITGDFKVDGNLITNNKGYAYLGEVQWIPSLYPGALPTRNATSSNLVLGGNVYKMNYTPDTRKKYIEHIETINFEGETVQQNKSCKWWEVWLGLCKPNNDGNTGNSNFINVTNNLKEGFNSNQVPTITKREPIRDNIDIDGKRNAFYYKESAANEIIYPSNNSTVFYSDLNYRGKKVYPLYRYNCNNNRICTKADSDFQFNGNNYFGNLATGKSIIIRGNTNRLRETTFESGAYIGENLILGDTSISNSSRRDNPEYYEKIKLDGPIFVNGDLIIEGVDGQFNTIIYVKGNVTIEYSVINGIGNTGSLIIFAEGNIDIQNNSVNQDTPSNIKGFFYSEKALEMFGVGSNLKIEGGISARRIVLNAIKGKASNSYFNGSHYYGGTYFEGQTNQVGKDSRLQIIYDPDIMGTYADLKSREPMVMNLDSPTIIERSKN